MPDALAITKAQGATLDVRFDWADYLGTDTIDSVAWSVSGVTAGTASNTTTTATQRISGGSVGTAATARCTITTAAGTVDARTVQIAVVSSLVAKEIEKAPGATLTIPAPTWSDLNGDTISAYAWTVPSGLSGSSTTSTIAIAGGTAGQDYALVCQITTAAGQVDQRVILVKVRDL